MTPPPPPPPPLTLRRCLAHEVCPPPPSLGLGDSRQGVGRVRHQTPPNPKPRTPNPKPRTPNPKPKPPLLDLHPKARDHTRRLHTNMCFCFGGREHPPYLGPLRPRDRGGRGHPRGGGHPAGGGRGNHIELSGLRSTMNTFCPTTFGPDHAPVTIQNVKTPIPKP